MEMFLLAEDISGMVCRKLVITFASGKRDWVSWGTGEGGLLVTFCSCRILYHVCYLRKRQIKTQNSLKAPIAGWFSLRCYCLLPPGSGRSASGEVCG